MLNSNVEYNQKLNSPQDVISEVKQLEVQKPFAILEFINTTPSWSGGPHEAKTYICLDEDAKNCIGPFLPTAQQLIGRLRWLLRIVEASLKAEKSDKLVYSNVEELNRKLFGDQKNAGIIYVHIEYQLIRSNGYTDPFITLSLSPELRDGLNFVKTSDLNLLRNLFEIVKAVGNELNEERKKQGKKPKTRNPYTDMITVMEIYGYELLRSSKGRKAESGQSLSGEIKDLYTRVVKKSGEILPQLRELCKLLTIPRVRLAMQAFKNIKEFYERQPLRPGKIKLTVKLYLKKGKAPLALDKEAIEKLAICLIAYTLTFLGLGKATSRGFGRFRLVQYKLMDLRDDEDLKELLEELKYVETDPMGVFKRSCNTLIHTSKMLLEDLIKSEVSTGDVAKLYRIPVLSYASINAKIVDPLKHPCVYALQELSSVDISQDPCINNKFVVTDMIEALSAIGKAVLKSTWKVRHRNVMNPGVAYHTWVLGLPRGTKQEIEQTSYYSGYYFSKDKISGGEDCKIPKNMEMPRRISPLIFIPYCVNNKCKALIIPFVTVSDFVIRINSLIHIGRHKDRRKGVKCLDHVIAISHALRNSKSGKVLGELMGIAKYSQKPGTPCQYADITMCVEEALNTALEWVENLLR